MATSAFRSTTRRGCSGSGTDANGVPSTPRSKRDPSPSGQGSHRRSSSMTDFSARYLSDCSSTSEYRSSYRRTSDIHGGRRSVCPSDSENEPDFSTTQRPRRRWAAESEDERTQKPSFSVTKAPDPQQNRLRRTLSSHDMSQYGSNMELDVVVPEKKLGTADSEDLVEEKTIRAVFDQMKQSLRAEPPVADVGMTNFLDSMRSEVRRAVSDIRTELEEALQRNEAGSAASDEVSRREAEGPVVIRSVADIQNEYTTKLEESERKVRELWSQIAVEERRCLELTKIVNELLPTPPPACLETSTPQVSSSGRRPPRRRNSAERQLVLESLDVEAQKYFEECVSISSFDCHGDSDDSMRVKESTNTSRRGRSADLEAALEPAIGESSVKGSAQMKDMLIGSDGVVLPWLKWESETGGSDKSTKQVTKKHTSPRASSSSGRSASFNRAGGSNDQFYRPGSAKSNGARKAGGVSLLETASDKLTSIPGIPLFTIDDQVAQVDHPLDVDTVLLDKIHFRCRVNNGELLLCQSSFLM
ncbi:hypothetical protein GOP47_0023673 [Adiantum capillus-veneris]|uniref:Uncharacterized protein n=1 Tax=Adiantum capillus-veneris TaxID=13818 RepID=A0A9D4U446_ADICA|nr:hypothetical protein GOP47_0023673 [Adiantum capillus-veneris]